LDILLIDFDLDKEKIMENNTYNLNYEERLEIMEKELIDNQNETKLYRDKLDLDFKRLEESLKK
jgi:hypothetical protein